MHLSEKAGDLGALSKFVFFIKNNLNKSEVAKIVEKTYKVQVTAVNIVKIDKNRIKKAIVTLKKGQTINEKI